MTDQPRPAAPARVLGPFDATCIVVGAIIGVGIFFTPARVASLTGDGGLALLAWAIAGFIALCGALVFAELGARYHASGAQYQVLRDAYGPCPAFLFVFCNATAIQTGAVAIIGFICAQNLLTLVGANARNNPVAVAIAAGLVASVILANAIGVRWGSRIQNLTVLAKVATLAAIAVLAAVWGSEPVLAAIPPSTEPNMPYEHGRLAHEAGVMAALVPAFFAYGGWQHALWISGEVRQPRRNLPRAIIIGVLLVIAVYLLTAWATLRLLGVEGVARSTTLAADAVAVVAPGWASRAVAAAVAVSAYGVLNAQLLSGPRLVYGMACDGRFFAPFARLEARGTPTAAILLIGIISLALLGVMLIRAGAIDPILNGVVFIDGVFFAMTGAALLILRRKERRPPDPASPATANPAGTEGPPAAPAPHDRGFRVPWYPLVPLLFVLGELGVVVGSYLDPSVRDSASVGVLWILSAAAVYAIWFRSTTSRATQAPPTRLP